MLGEMEGYGIHPSTGLPIMSSSHDISNSGEDSSTSLKREIEDVFGNSFNSPHDSFHGDEVIPLNSPPNPTPSNSSNQSMEKQPVSLYRHTIADICILVNPSTKEIIPQQSTQVLEYMQTNHAHDSIQSLINSKILVMVGGSSISTRASLVNPAEKKPMKDPKIENEPIASNSDDFYGFIEVSGDEFVTGTYYICDEKSSGASEEPVYKHQERDSYIFYDPDEGWKIGDQDSMTTYDYWYKSGHHTLKHWLKSVEWGGGLENPNETVKLTFHIQDPSDPEILSNVVKEEEYSVPTMVPLPEYPSYDTFDTDDTFETKYDVNAAPSTIKALPLPRSMKKERIPKEKKKHSPPLKKMCPECGLNVYNLTNHIIGVHGNEKHECPHCQLVFKTKARLDKHIKWVHEKTPCELCGELVGNLSRHMISVHEDQKHPCVHCGRIFKSKDQLQKHIAWSHDKIQCEQCGDLVGKGKMQRHISSKHTSIYDKKFKCDVCGKSFDRNAKLKDHKNIHTGEKPYQCKYCNACFASIGTHAMHQRSHLGHRRTK